MRDFKGMKRQRGRNRGGGGNQGKPQQNANRAFESNGPDSVKIRGNAQHVFERYQQLARDAASAGDRVLAENYLQHAEHYFRVIRALQPNRPTAEIIGRETFTSGFDIDFEDESGAQAEPEVADEAAVGEDGGDQRPPRQDRDRYEGRQRDDRQRDDRQRDDRPRDGQREDRPRDERGEGGREGGRRERFRDRERFNRDDRRDRRDDRPAQDGPPAEGQPAAAETPAEGSPMLRSEDGGVSHAPAFLQAREPRPEAAPEEAAAAERPRTRRRRTPRSFEAEGGAAEPAAEAPAPAEEG